MEATNPPRRFGWALLGSALLVGSTAFVLYLDNPTTPLKPTVLTHQSASFFEKSSSTNPNVDPELTRLLSNFVDALERRDQDELRSHFPTMSRKDARLLRSIRARLGIDARLSLGPIRVERTVDGVTALDFVILSKQPYARGELSLPFHANVRKQNGLWRIEALN